MRQFWLMIGALKVFRVGARMPARSSRASGLIHDQHDAADNQVSRRFAR